MYIGGSALGFTIPAPLYAATPSHASRQAGSRIVVQGKVGQRHVRMLTADRTGWLFCRVALTVKICQSDVTRLVQQGNNAVTEAENAAQSGCRHLV